jgi:hypothetical protein
MHFPKTAIAGFSFCFSVAILFVLFKRTFGFTAVKLSLLGLLAKIKV